MRMPGFGAEASLYKASELRAADAYQRQRSRRSPKRRATIEPQQARPRANDSYSAARCQSCLAAQKTARTIARAVCIGRCKTFVGQNSRYLDSCLGFCQAGEDYEHPDYPLRVLPGAPELRPGYCRSWCIRPYHLESSISLVRP